MIYEKVKELADKKKLSIKEVEQKAGLANGAISKWNESMPRVDNLQAVAKALEVEIGYFLKDI